MVEKRYSRGLMNGKILVEWGWMWWSGFISLVEWDEIVIDGFILWFIQFSIQIWNLSYLDLNSFFG